MSVVVKQFESNGWIFEKLKHEYELRLSMFETLDINKQKKIIKIYTLGIFAFWEQFKDGPSSILWESFHALYDLPPFQWFDQIGDS